QGRAEFHDIPPGKYKLTLAENEAWVGFAANSHTTALPAVGGIDVKPADRKALAAMEPLKLDLKRGTGEVRARLRLSPQPAWVVTGTYPTMTLRLEGERSSAEITLNDSFETYWQDA